MKFDVEELNPTRKKFRVEIPPEDIAHALEKAYTELNSSVKIDGFRPGKVPKGILEKRYGKGVEAEVAEKLVSQYYYRAVHESKTVPVEAPSIEEKEISIEKGRPLSFTAVVEVKPEITLCEYKGIEVKEEPLEVAEEELTEALDEIREVHSTLENVIEDRPAAKDDYAVIDFEGFVDGMPLDGGRAENYALSLGSGTFIPGFEDQLMGVRRGEAREVRVRFPDDYKNKEIAGKDALFKVTLKELKKKVKPELDDEFAKDSGLGQTLDEVKEKVRKDVLSYKGRARASAQKDMIIKELLKRNEFELPSSMVEKELRSIIISRHQEMLRLGQTPSEVGFDLNRFREEARPQAEERVKTILILAEIADREGISISDGEMEAGIRRLAADTGYSPGRIRELYEKRDGSLEGLRGILVEDKVLEMLLRESVRK